PTPEPKAVIVEPEPVVAVVRKTVHFEFDSAQLTQESKTELMQLIEQVTSDGLPNSKIVIAGHADATGPESYNETLSQER
ncbi:MAG: OmpA family protein, partial [Gammaproteobacteria bacterium]|nr:OmpA family protein [Gammaproteobacteria bacterium]